MPELPDIVAYESALTPLLMDQVLRRVRVVSPSLLRTFDPPVSTAEGRRVLRLSRLGKRIVLSLEGELHLVVHLMIAGRFQWEPGKASAPRGKIGLMALTFDPGTLQLTEASTQKRAALHVVQGPEGLALLDPGGIDPLTMSLEAFDARIRMERRTLKRALTDPRLFAGIGNAYSDEILHHARLSPIQMTFRMEPEQIRRLHGSTQHTLSSWCEVLVSEAQRRFPKKVTAFRPEMRVHGKFEHPCPVCGDPIQRLVYASNECNYCVTCQTGGRLLRDRSLSRLLKDDWPATLEELEELRRR